MLRRLGVVRLDLHAVIRAKELRVLAVPHVVLVVELQVPHFQPVFFRFHALQLHRMEEKWGQRQSFDLMVYLGFD